MRREESDIAYTKAVAIRDPLGDHPERFQRHLESQHYSQASIIQYGDCIARLRNQMRLLEVDLKDLDTDLAVRLVAKPGLGTSRSRHNAFIVKKFIAFLTALGASKPEIVVTPDETARGRLKREYEEYLLRQRGLSKRTVIHKWGFANRFLTFYFQGVESDLSKVAPVDIVRFMQHLISRDRPYRDKTAASHLRSFFLFLFESGRTSTNLAPSVPRIAQQHRATLPRHLAPEELEDLLAAVRVDSPIGRRNYAMVLLLARLGLRASEIVAMRVDDIDWRAGEILIRGKGQQHDRLPLPQDVGTALAEYLLRDRNTASRALFVTERAPRRPFSRGNFLNRILKVAFAKAKLEPPTKYIGTHILRHTLATSLARHGASLAEIGDMLRHRSQETTMIYAKLDIDGLRSIALPWPMTGGAQ
jgi:site-specific recombinase XerD